MLGKDLLPATPENYRTLTRRVDTGEDIQFLIHDLRVGVSKENIF